MLDDDQRAFLSEARGATLFARRRDGRPTGWPMTPLWPGDGWLYFNTYATAAKATMMRRDGRVATVLTRAGGGPALAFTAAAELVVDADELAALVPVVLRDDGFVPAPVLARTQERLRSGKRVLFRMRPGTAWWIDPPAGWRDGRRPPSDPPYAGSRRDGGRAGRDRASLALTDHELDQFLAGSRVAAVGWPESFGSLNIGLLAVRSLGGAIELGPGCPPAGTAVCAVIDEGASYSEIVGVMVHGAVDASGRLPLDDVVSFSFAKGQA